MSNPKDLLKARLAMLPPGLPNQFNANARSQPYRRRKDYTPVKWNKYFEGREDVKVGDNTFRVYTAGKEGPVLLLLHGGGHSGLSWAVFAVEMMALCDCRLLAIDLRGHGHTKTTDDSNLAADVLSKDVADVMDQYFCNEDMPPVVILGHSMGGAVAVHIAASNLLKTLVGLVVIDVVEGTALEALSAMDGFLKSRPKAFKSLEESIEWSIRSNQVRNLESARVSIPGQLYRCTKERFEQILQEERSTNTPSPVPPIPETISEEELGDEIVLKEEEHEGHHQASSSESPQKESEEEYLYTWRIDLTKTEVFWRGWFQDMSKLFLSSPPPKLLILAGIDRLDKDLTIGQMQGKFQMHVLPNCGHTVHEDDPKTVALLMMEFLVRHKFATAKTTYHRLMPAC